MKTLKTISLFVLAFMLTAGISLAAYPDTFTTWVAGTTITSTWLNSIETLLGLDPAKGSLLVGSSTTAGAWLAIGSDGKILTASSTATYGVSWETSTAGINSLGGLTTTTQLFASSGPALSISSSGSTHTFTLATSTGSVTGVLSSTDWTTFNNKVGTSLTLTSGTGLTGGGDLSVNRTLNVGAGTNIIANTDDVAVSSTPAFTSVHFPDTTKQSTAYKGIGFNVFNATTTATATTTIQKLFYTASEITQIDCSTNGADATIGADERASSTPDTLGTDVFTAGTLVCDSNGNSTSTFANATIAAGSILNFDLDATANSTTTVRVYIRYKEQ